VSFRVKENKAGQELEKTVKMTNKRNLLGKIAEELATF